MKDHHPEITPKPKNMKAHAFMVGTVSPKPKPRKKQVRSSAKKTVKKHKTSNKHIPGWKKGLIVVAILLFLLCFAYFYLLRPYSYRWRPCHGREMYDICMPCCYEVHGIDISHHQGKIDWNKLADTWNSEYPIEFIFMKATEGCDHSDKAFDDNYHRAGELGFVRGAYHFFSPYTDPLKQADFFIQTVNLKVGDLPPVLDVEVSGHKSAKEIQARVISWLNRVEQHYKVKPIIYTSYKFKKKYLNDSIFDDYPYWIAHYYVDSVRYDKKWYFWQHSDIGAVPGIKGDVDLNVFNGSLDQLDEMTIQKIDLIP